MHIDVFVEAHLQFVCHGNNKKIYMAVSPVRRESLSSEPSQLELTQGIEALEEPTMCFWQHKMDMLK